MASCNLDQTQFPPLLSLAPGLARLPRQIGLFGDFRRDMLAAIRDRPPLAGWRARDENDYGLLILDWWAYVCDVLAFYTSQHTNELFLGTAQQEKSLRRIVKLVGYRPRAATAARAWLAAFVDGASPTVAPAGARFLADAFDDQPPQEFELCSDTELDPLRNEWEIAPLREDRFDPTQLLLDPGSRNLVDDALFVLDLSRSPSKSLSSPPTNDELEASLSVHTVASIAPETALDGVNYLRLTTSRPPDLPETDLSLKDVRLWTFTQSAPVAALSGTQVTLQGLFPQIRTGELVVLEDTSATADQDPEARLVASISYDTTVLVARPVQGDNSPDLELSTAIADLTTPTTVITLSGSSSLSAESSKLHFMRVKGGQLVSPQKTQVAAADLGSSALLSGRHDGSSIEGRGKLLLEGARESGRRVSGSVNTESTSGRSTLSLPTNSTSFQGSLRTPVKVYGNLLEVTRGKSVEETLGSGSGSTPFQRFQLSKKPLTWITDQDAGGRRRSTLRVWVDNIEWTEVENLFLSGPEERVFTVDLDEDGGATITFGGGGHGRPPSLGTNNVLARYRFGGGEAPPPARSIRQIAGPVPGLRRVTNPTPASGGGEGDRPEDLRFNAPASAATFDRAVSAEDFAALARDRGALNAIAVNEWVPERLREGVVVTVILPGEFTEESACDLEAHLASRAAETTPIRVVPAERQPSTIEITYSVKEDADPERTQREITAVLLDEFTGWLSPRRTLIGGPIFRSEILGRAAKARGVDRVLGMTVNQLPAPNVLPLLAHGYLDPKLVLTEVSP